MLARGIIGQLKYNAIRRKNKTSVCVFCRKNTLNSDRVMLKETDSMYVTENDFPYKRWSNQVVKRHLMIVPKRHTLQISELSDKEQAEMMQLIATYDQEGYSFYMRSHIDKFRSVAHIHGHLFLYQ